MGSDGMIRKTIRIDERVYREIEKASGGNFSRWMNFLIDKELKKDNGVSSARDTEALVNGEKLDSILDKHLLEALSKKGKNVLENLTDVEIAKMAVQRAPKAAAIDQDYEDTKLSLRNSLKRLPDIPDLRKELVNVKGELSRLKLEYELQTESVRRLKKLFDSLKEYGIDGTEVFDGIRELCKRVAKKSYDLREEDELRDMVDTGIRMLVLQLDKEAKHGEKRSGTTFR